MRSADLAFILCGMADDPTKKGQVGACSKHAFAMRGTACMCCVNDITPMDITESGFAASYDLYSFDCDYSLEGELTGFHDDCADAEPCAAS